MRDKLVMSSMRWSYGSYINSYTCNQCQLQKKFAGSIKARLLVNDLRPVL